MPIYETMCKDCGKVDSYYATVKDRHKVPECECGHTPERIISASNLSIFNEYVSPVTGELIDDKSKHRNHKKQHGLIEVGNEPVKQSKAYSYDANEVKKEIAKQLYK